ncbi:ATP-binding protein [Pokkaliibacter sp. MBI-7]|uniref:Lon protease family protein n=1 Tax=Pokkaliibacter sp. MBI-7 TaxID=3040600 RepID=UPI00244D51FE|nr:ATP-binding protein [Pokkaliibacter sp. MBI-7]MDH2436117.1 ATP-binding protein [Pokkaliibacter sp. MBI-7]
MAKAPRLSPLQPEQLSVHLSKSDLPFSSTADLEPLSGILGQERAVRALQFGVAMRRPGYNIFVMGEPGTGRASYVRSYLKSEAKRQKTPSDWVYVNNFSDQRSPNAIELPAEAGAAFKDDINQLIDNLLLTFPAAFEDPRYQQSKNAIEREFNQNYEEALERVEKAASRQGIALFREAGSVSFAPIVEGKPLDDADFTQLSEEERDRINSQISDLESQLRDELIGLPLWRRETSEKLRTLNQSTISESIAPLLAPLEEKYESNQEVLTYLQQVASNLQKIVIEELVDQDTRDEPAKREALSSLYSPNLAVSRKQTAGTPVVYEPHPTYNNLFGRIEYLHDQGALVTNYQQICAGALHAANGGYLIVDADKVLSDYVWDALKRALKRRELKIESPYAEMGLVSTTTLSPETIPLDVKLVLIGSRDIYYALQSLDPEFSEMFRVLVDYEDYIERTPDNLMSFCRLIRDRCDKEGYLSLSDDAIARLIAHSARLAEHQHHMTASIGELFELLAEADYLARLGSAEQITGEHVQRALKAKQERTGRVSEEVNKQILDGTVLLETSGKAVGKINGLTVMSIGDAQFGAPARISVTAYPGSKGIVDIEREVDLGQSIHSKGVMILSGYLGNMYAQETPMTLCAHIAMEQSYGYIDGDSASLAELCCLISALIKAPLKQSLAITGSVNQHGEVQPIGGVNEKIEGFFRVCQARGLTGEQGVVIPKSNVQNLVLEDDVVDAVRQGKFSIYAVSTVDEALELFTGQTAGVIRKDGTFPKRSLNARVIDRLEELARISLEFGDGDEE